MPHVLRRSTDELAPGQLADLRRLFAAAWPSDDADGPFTEEDFAHALGGVHFVIEEAGVPISHASVVERTLLADGRPLRTGYVEAMATAPAFRRRGYATAIMEAVGDHVDRSFELGALGTGLLDFYSRLGWTLWQGPTLVRTGQGPVRTPDDDGSILVRFTPTTPALDVTGSLSCEWRPGDVW